jgi:hypothetical protein
MPMAEAAATMPSLEEARAWVGAEIADLEGAEVGQVHGFFLDAGGGAPAWLIARVGRRRRTRMVAVPLRECAGARFGVWVSQRAETIRRAPMVDPTKPLRREHELTICAHFGIGEAVGRAAEVAGRPEGAVTAMPLGG